MTRGGESRVAVEERRAEPRGAPAHLNWQRLALIKPALPVHIVNVSRSGCLVEGSLRLRPGTRTTLTAVVNGDPRPHVVICLRCRVTRLSPIRYQAALAFAHPGIG